MPIYDYRCPQCNIRWSAAQSVAEYSDPYVVDICVKCMVVGKRVYSSFSISTPFTPHYNDSLGRRVNSPSDLKSATSQLSDQLSAQTGMTHDIQAVDPREAASTLGVTSDGLESTYRTHYNSPDRAGRSLSEKDTSAQWLP